MSSADSRRNKPRGRLGVVGLALLLMAGLPCGGAGAQTTPHTPEHQKKERIELFLGLLKRRAQQILDARTPKPPPLISYSSGLAQGYESNVDLDGEKRGDFFTQETFEVEVRPRITSWLRGDFTYELLHTHYADLTDSNLLVNRLESVLQVTPTERVRVDLGYAYSSVNFPLDTNNSFFNHRTELALSFAQTAWLTHKTAWAFQLRKYDTRKARDGNRNRILRLDRDDKRQTVSHELRFRFPKTSVRIAGAYYQNHSNDAFQDFYDWQDIRFRGVVSRILSPKWIGVLVTSHEHRNFEQRNVSSLSVAERDDLLTLAGSLIYLFHDNAQFTYSLTYRHQDSNNPLLDFIDWTNRLGVTVNF